MKQGRIAHTGTAANRPSGILQLPSFSYVLMFLYVQKDWPSESDIDPGTGLSPTDCLSALIMVCRLTMQEHSISHAPSPLHHNIKPRQHVAPPLHHTTLAEQQRLIPSHHQRVSFFSIFPENYYRNAVFRVIIGTCNLNWKLHISS